MFQYPRRQNVSILPILYYRRTLLQLFNEHWIYLFFSSSDTHQSHHLLRCHATGINSSFNSFLSALRFSKLICQAKKLFCLEKKLKEIRLTKKLL